MVCPSEHEDNRQNLFKKSANAHAVVRCAAPHSPTKKSSYIRGEKIRSISASKERGCTGMTFAVMTVQEHEHLEF